jgi:hypothetical protein
MPPPPPSFHSDKGICSIPLGSFDRFTQLDTLWVEGRAEDRGRQRAGREGGAMGEREEHRGRQRAIQEEESAPLSL